MFEHRYLRDVVTLQLDVERCNGCRMCTAVCPHAVFDFYDKRSHIGRRDDCMECGACQLNCEAGAIRVTSGVGCAQAVINGLFGRKGGGCACLVEDSSAEHSSSDCC